MFAVCCKENLMMQTDIFVRKFFVSSSLVPMALPSRRETHFWYIVPDKVQNVSLLNQYLELLSPCERENVFQMKGDQLQKGALLARALVRTTLARYTNSHLTPRSLKFRKNRFGKPEVEWQHDGNWEPPSLLFNMSHTSSLIACGVTVDMPIGIDVEEKQRKISSNVLSFARRFFSPCEVEFLHAFSDPEIQRQELIKLWTLKEAYVKALGRGFSAAPFRDFSIRYRVSKGLQIPVESNSDAFEIVVEAFGDPENLTSNWQFTLFELASGHFAAICIEKDDNIKGKESNSQSLKVWKTIPFVGDELDTVAILSGSSQV